MKRSDKVGGARPNEQESAQRRGNHRKGRTLPGAGLVIGDQTIERLFHCLIAGDSPQARRVIEGTLADGTTVDELLIEAYRPIAAMIESLCRTRQLTDRARDHATVLLQNLLDDVRSGQLQPASYSCEIETTLHREAEERVGETVIHRLRCMAPPPRASELKSPFTTMSFRNGVLRVRLVGPQVNERESRIMREEIDRALDLVGPGLKAFILDLTDIQIMSSVGLNMCIELRNGATNHGARCLMVGVNRRFADLFTLLNVDRMYDCAGFDDALAEVAA